MLLRHASSAVRLHARRRASTLPGAFDALPAHVAQATHRVAEAFTAARVPYCVVGAVAANAHGHRRATQDVDVLVNKADIGRAAAAVDGRGYRPRYKGAQRSWRDVVSGVDIDLLASGEYPGDGLPKPVAFPALDGSPHDCCVATECGVRVINLPRLIEVGGGE